MKLDKIKYFSKKDNWFVIGIIFLTILYGLYAEHIFSALQKKPWKNWEDAAIISTLIYTVWLYCDGFFISKKFAHLIPKIHILGLIVAGIISLLIVSGFLIANTILGFINNVHFEFPRWSIMLALFIMALLFSIIDKVLGNTSQGYSEGYSKIFYYSDLPITFAFGILFFYSLLTQESDILNAFFAGSIAFQMMLSNFLWSFMDDKVFE